MMNENDATNLLDALYRAAREAAEAPLTAEEDGETFFRFVIDGALHDLAARGHFPEVIEVRRALLALTGYDAPA